ncbi:TetR/AcrR family transcriptional regulator [Arenibacterium halophilum]|uniref:TetR/AcrR family transcriptional regulator n=1 Tax=Arenibacterium halophilum TaxID=2583821 RepID=A0ABY2XE45_9RHOB|nr:TetR/AcrR family transcriptional regulator [Arenibacterium halophilum]TMV15290.1 TetR/AcrR family transcriptional regulator [Arenibacterium halophilum]
MTRPATASIPASASGSEDRETAGHTARLRILDAAEHTFSEGGFGGASMKAIAVRAGVAQGLLHYHFDTKDGLYAAVIERRAGAINAEREAMLARVDTAAPDALPRILEALLRPPLGPAGGGQAYARIFAGLLVGGTREADLVARLYDPTARRFIAALGAACPETAPETLSWAYNFAIGALIATVARSGRPERLVDTETVQDTDAVVARLVEFATGGVEAAIARTGRI